MTRRRDLGMVALFALVFGAGPTVGDVGSCGDDPVDADSQGYTAARKSLDCERCRECNVTTARCTHACDDKVSGEVVLPDSCKPLQHDVDVCIRALRAASCEDFAGTVDDEHPTSPSECAFCRVAPDGATR